MELSDLKLALRNLVKNKAFTLINITGLTVGLTACLYMAVLLRHETSFDKFHPDSDRTYRVLSAYTSPDKNMQQGYCDALAGPEILEAIPGIETGCRVSPAKPVKLIKDEGVYMIDAVRYADPDFFSFFGFELLTGNPENILEAPKQIVITKRLALEIFGDENPVGQSLRTSEDADWEIIAVCKDARKDSHINFDIIASIKTAEADPNLYLTWGGGMQFLTYLKLDPAVSPESIDLLFPDFLYPRINKKLEGAGWKLDYKLQAISDIHLGETLDYDESSNRTVSYLMVISSIALLILFLAIINYINLASALARLRFKEIGIRKILGASRSRIRNQMLSESMVLTLLAGILAPILLHFVYPKLNKLTGSEFSPYAEPFLYVMVIIGIVLVSGFLSGTAPAILLAGRNAAQGLQERIKGRMRNTTRNILVSLQFTVAIFLIICFIVIQKQSSFVLQQDLGFEKESIISIPNDKGYTFDEAKRLKQEMKKLPEIQSVSLSSEIPGRAFTANGYLIEGKDDPELVNVVYADNEFLDCFGIELLSGRNFRKKLDAEKTNFLVNKALVDHAGWEQPLGKTIHRNFQREVIGVFSDFHFASLHEPIAPLILSVQPQSDGWHYYQLNIRHGSADTQDLLIKIRSIWENQMPDALFDPIFVDEFIQENYGSLENQTKLITLFSIVAIVIACIGLLGMSAFVAFTRRKEIGIRKVNGALVSDIVLKLNFDMLKWVLIAMILAIPLSFPAINKWLMSFAYKTDISWWIFPLAASLAIGIALLTISWQSFRVARMDPVRTLRYE